MGLSEERRVADGAIRKASRKLARKGIRIVSRSDWYPPRPFSRSSVLRLDVETDFRDGHVDAAARRVEKELCKAGAMRVNVWCTGAVDE